MLGDIVPNTAAAQSNGNVAAVPKPGGYGSSTFGPMTASVPAEAPVQAPVSSPVASNAYVQPVQYQAPASEPAPLDATPAEVASLDPLAKRSGSKVPLVLTVVGVLVFVTGVSGLFMYALSGS